MCELIEKDRYKTQCEDVQRILRRDPKAAGKPDEYGRYPLHIGMKNKAPADAIKVVVAACPEATSLDHLFKMKVAWVTAQDVQQVLDNDPGAAGKPDKNGKYPHQDSNTQKTQPAKKKV